MSSSSNNGIKDILDYIQESEKFISFLKKSFEISDANSDSMINSLEQCVKYTEQILKKMPFQHEEKAQIAKDISYGQHGYTKYDLFFHKDAVVTIKKLYLYHGRPTAYITFEEDPHKTFFYISTKYLKKIDNKSYED